MRRILVIGAWRAGVPGGDGGNRARRRTSLEVKVPVPIPGERTELPAGNYTIERDRHRPRPCC